MGAIERLIHQKKFESDHQRAVISLIYLANAITANNNEILKPYKITQQQYNALRILRGNRNNVSSVQYIKERLLDNNSDASRLIDRLVKLNLAERKICSEDRRSADIRINEKEAKLKRRKNIWLLLNTRKKVNHAKQNTSHDNWRFVISVAAINFFFKNFFSDETVKRKCIATMRKAEQEREQKKMMIMWHFPETDSDKQNVKHTQRINKKRNSSEQPNERKN